MKKFSGFLVAEFEMFPGLRMPLLSDEECKARGIERPKFPPFETWTPEQQQAGKELGKILTEMAVKQAFRAVLRHLELMEVEAAIKADFEKEAAGRALAELRAGQWKPEQGEVGGLEEAMGWVLEALIRGDPNRSLGADGDRGRHPRPRHPAPGKNL